MTHVILRERVGKPMGEKVRGADGKPALIAYACRVNGYPDGKKLDLEYGSDSTGAFYVQVIHRSASGKSRGKGCWKLEAICNRDANGLKGFVDFAKTFGIEGHQLAHVVEQHKHGS